MSVRALLGRWWTAFDYGILLPVLARLPMSWGRMLARQRGRFYGRIKRDWRSFSFADDQLYQRTFDVYKQLTPQASDAQCHAQVVLRYESQSLEELEGACLPYRDISSWPLRVEGLEALNALLETKQRIVLLTAHFGSSILGVTMLGCLGMPVLGMSSSVVDDPRVHPAIARFYRRKYAAMASYMNGGSVIDRQGNAAKFVRFLLRGGAVGIVGDLPPDPGEKPIVKMFLGKQRGFAPGVVKLAEMTESSLLAYVCVYSDGEYVLRFSAPEQDPYQFIEEAILSDPSKWWAADLLPLLPEYSND